MLVAIRFNLSLKRVSHRGVATGKHVKVTILAVMRKLTITYESPIGRQLFLGAKIRPSGPNILDILAKC